VRLTAVETTSILVKVTFGVRTGGYMLNVDEALSYHRDAIGIGRKGTIDKHVISSEHRFGPLTAVLLHSRRFG
jgi:hypothetical protein